MVRAIRQRVRVKEGGVVEVRSEELRPGAEADVIVLVDHSPVVDHGVGPRRTLSSFIGAGKGLFKSAEEVDAHIRHLRDEWDN